MPRNFFFQMIDGHLVNAKPENESDIPDTEKKSHLSYRKQDLTAFIRNRIDKTFKFDGTCRRMARQIAYDRNKRVPADTPPDRLIKPDTTAAEKQLGHFLATGRMNRRCFTYLKNVLYVTDKDIADDHREQNRKRKHDRAEARDLNYFSRHIPFLLTHRDRIISRKEYYNVKSDRFGCSFAYTGRSAPVTLGELLCHYADGAMKEPCPRCGSQSYVYFACGSPLSGTNIYHAACPKCRKQIRSSAETVWHFFKPLMDFHPLYAYEPSPYTVRGLVRKLRREILTRRLH